MLKAFTHFCSWEFVAARAVWNSGRESVDPTHRTIGQRLAILILRCSCILPLSLAHWGTSIRRDHGWMKRCRRPADQILVSLSQCAPFRDRLMWLTRSPMVHLEEISGSYRLSMSFLTSELGTRISGSDR